ncbi:hypothetical protein EV44_g3496 [Erysiphe necator]|uniref:Uncharacterized protein n=1 Tax=Uncinula necator TaxID=52586 RepID=A0A0B1P6U1_UNCNE|nr:hypothetical protein EV44_g3496 [Erysiphe necator]
MGRQLRFLEKQHSKPQILAGVEKANNSIKSAEVAVTYVRKINQQNTEQSKQAGITLAKSSIASPKPRSQNLLVVIARHTENISEKAIKMLNNYRRNDAPLPELHTIIQSGE